MKKTGLLDNSADVSEISVGTRIVYIHDLV